MSLRPEPLPPIPNMTAAAVRAACFQLSEECELVIIGWPWREFPAVGHGGQHSQREEAQQRPERANDLVQDVEPARASCHGQCTPLQLEAIFLLPYCRRWTGHRPEA